MGAAATGELFASLHGFSGVYAAWTGIRHHEDGCHVGVVRPIAKHYADTLDTKSIADGLQSSSLADSTSQGIYVEIGRWYPSI